MKKIINLLINLIFFVAAAYLLIGFEPKFVFRIEHLAVGLVGGYIVYLFGKLAKFGKKQIIRIWNIFIESVLVASLIEETIFRLGIITVLFNNSLLGLLVSILLWSVLHILGEQVFGIARYYRTLPGFLHSILSGTVFSIVYYLTDFNLLVPIISHAFYNFLVWLSVAEPFLSILTSNLRGRLVALQFFLSNLFSKYSPYVNSILKLFKGFRNGKGISMITFVITTALSVAGIALTLTFLLPEIDRAKASGVINDALQQLDIVDNIVREVATEGTGSQRTYNLRVREGTYQVKNETGSFEFEYTTKQSPLDAGVTAKRGNVVLSTTVAGAKAYESDEDSDGLPELVIENEALKATFRKYPFTYTTWGIRDVG